MTDQQWRVSVELVNSIPNSLAMKTTMEIETNGGSGEMSTALTSKANTTSSIHTNSLIDN
jgi:hypothetical protein